MSSSMVHMKLTFGDPPTFYSSTSANNPNVVTKTPSPANRELFFRPIVGDCTRSASSSGIDSIDVVVVQSAFDALCLGRFSQFVITQPLRDEKFVSAIENQVHRVQSALCENGEQPLCWVDLNKEERDDLAMFLSGSSQTFESFSSESINLSRCHGESHDYVIDIDERGSPESAGNKNGTRRTWSSPNVPDVSALRIDAQVDAKEEQACFFFISLISSGNII
ncbi:unnamed protein product [Eruca vesicaria subsp. sativa]|uniref:Revoluta n=1 Tax=Eruca vesicaria subsp. sativa TaxID=29727 RepID=A0ABC8L8P9_ERUVS|nr:unnamed protein product [Eruca vesicaria subsp. sativa]